jgi:hypothetical protein
MPDVENATPFGVRAMPSCDRDGRDVLLIVVGAQFDLPDPGYDDPRLRLFRTQEQPPLADEYVGEPGRSSIRREGQSSYTKPATDIYICGDACAPNGEPVTEMRVNIRVGPCAVDLRLHGDRVWQRAVTLGVRPSAPAPFVIMPLVWERAYGGMATGSTEERPAFEPRNPIGCGFETDPDAAIGKPVPNIEDPRQPLSRVSDRPPSIGVGPVARHWHPRASYAGTYDDAWKRQRAPLWPTDFDERFFCGAIGQLQASPHLKGGEEVILHGLHPNGPIRFLLPTLRMVSRSRFIDRAVRTTLVLDGVLIETDVSRLTMYYRAAVPAPLSLIKHRETLLRLLEPWETNGAR